MINNKPKTAFQIILGGIMLVSVATIGCNDSSSTTETKTDTTSTKMVEETPVLPPAVKDTIIDTTANQRPIVPTNSPSTP